MSARGDGPSLVLGVDDDPGVLDVLRRIFGRDDSIRFVGVERPSLALEFLEEEQPDLILLDVLMPEMSGYELCAEILEREALQYVPVIFVTVLGEEEDRAQAFAAGAVDLVTKPFDVNVLTETIERHLSTVDRWRDIEATGDAGSEAGSEVEAPEGREQDARPPQRPRTWNRFKEYLGRHLDPADDVKETVEAAGPGELYSLAEPLGIGERTLARYVADYMDLPVLSGIDPGTVDAGVLPTPFCRANTVVPVHAGPGVEGPAVVLSNPFDLELLDTLQRVVWKGGEPEMIVAEPHVIEAFFTYGEGGDAESVEEAASESKASKLNADRMPQDMAGGDESDHVEVLALGNELLRRAVSERASDMHVEPKSDHAEVRFRIDGDLEEARRISPEQSRRLIARFKALSEMDVAEKRKPQDGALEAVIHGRRFKLRLATTTTPHGESLVVRFIEPFASPPSLEDLGASPDQAATLQEFMHRNAGLILIVGPTGAGKSTTIFSLLNEVEGTRRSVITVEDPVEYRIPFANQQQVNEKAGVTFESLLRSAVRQDPDILLLGEVRDLFSAKASLDFSSSGHLTLSTMHSANATTAIFRMERLGVERGAMADAVLAVVAQKLLKRLCNQCRMVRPITDEEQGWLEPFMDDVPTEVAEPVGCPTCRDTGFKGRVGIFEVLEFDPQVARLVREGASIADIRNAVLDRGNFLIAQHAALKVADLVCSPRQVYEHVLLEEAVKDAPAAEPESGADEESPAESHGPSVKAEAASGGGNGGEQGPEASILVVEDDPDGRALIQRYLELEGHHVTTASDGAEALIQIGSGTFDLILSDINMPNLDGLRLMEILTQKGVETPVVFLTAQTSEEFEVRCLELGAEDFLVKPVKRNVLSLRISRVLKRHGHSN